MLSSNSSASVAMLDGGFLDTGACAGACVGLEAGAGAAAGVGVGAGIDSGAVVFSV